MNLYGLPFIIWSSTSLKFYKNSPISHNIIYIFACQVDKKVDYMIYSL